jgi:hypothetical protein
MAWVHWVGFVGTHKWILLGSIVNDDDGGNRKPNVGFDFNMASFVVSFVVSMAAIIAMSFVVDDTAGHKNAQGKYQANPQAGRSEKSFGGGTGCLLEFGKKHN